MKISRSLVALVISIVCYLGLSSVTGIPDNCLFALCDPANFVI